ncbi:UDP-N-acetylglucosamine 2-epimerase (non-hydrolyzing) [Pseudomonas sp. R2.Fl]|nr:UDP-N-acetylglucosamine 2-epimerase (non-hydrolyzing) [Pseudomonas sp. R2.Fl]
MKQVMVAFGTRPEAIKMAPVISALLACEMKVQVVATAQHRDMLDQVLDLFGIEPDVDLNLMRANQALPDLFAGILTGMTEILSARRPAMLLVHGDTSTTMATALAGFYARVPVGHIEAGLRTGNMDSPWPEEMNRRLTAPLASLHFAPTYRARDNLLLERCAPESIDVTGNTVVDALQSISTRLDSDMALARRVTSSLPEMDSRKRLILVTGHRRENHGAGLERVCNALRTLTQRGDIQIIYAVHANPNVDRTVRKLLEGLPDVFLLPPLDYASFVFLLKKAYLVLTDSGGIQEEAPSFGKPVLVTRTTSERPEAIEAGTAKLVGTDPEVIVREISGLLDDREAYAAMAFAHSPFGDGSAAMRIARAVRRFLQERSSELPTPGVQS